MEPTRIRLPGTGATGYLDVAAVVRAAADTRVGHDMFAVDNKGDGTVALNVLSWGAGCVGARYPAGAPVASGATAVPVTVQQ